MLPGRNPVPEPGLSGEDPVLCVIFGAFGGYPVPYPDPGGALGFPVQSSCQEQGRNRGRSFRVLRIPESRALRPGRVLCGNLGIFKGSWSLLRPGLLVSGVQFDWGKREAGVTSCNMAASDLCRFWFQTIMPWYSSLVLGHLEEDMTSSGPF